ncbi:SpoIIAA-like [Andreprevotia lacus DSM 23236]|jgi:sulfur carrier protein ThiS|uniref:SpoIIAA-like n=1 Tax=Andreprevotia lacus DSM 23236 TaxID=1121001 RepID=A0A1W1XP58_9NEIS|nr:STAS/SEC14 domain-containing protein [Andreprevotia lacus]SMC25298.1 SpoIIAA-like [Andreprevotia lacus DSM 23236]
MLTISHEPNYIYVAVAGELTVHDFREFENDVLYELRFHGAVNLLFDLTEMLGYTLDMAIEEIRFTRAHRRDFQRVAVVANDQWITWSAWLNQLLSDAEIEVFTDVEGAQAWLNESAASAAA